MARSQDCGVFDLDEDSTCSDAGAGGARSPSTDDHDIATTGGPSDRSSIDPFRRAMPQLEAEEDVCSICLDAFTDDDPGNATVCGYALSLQPLYRQPLYPLEDFRQCRAVKTPASLTEEGDLVAGPNCQ